MQKEHEWCLWQVVIGCPETLLPHCVIQCASSFYDILRGEKFPSFTENSYDELLSSSHSNLILEPKLCEVVGCVCRYEFVYSHSALFFDQWKMKRIAQTDTTMGCKAIEAVRMGHTLILIGFSVLKLIGRLWRATMQDVKFNLTSTMHCKVTIMLHVASENHNSRFSCVLCFHRKKGYRQDLH